VAADVAEVIGFVASRPSHVNVDQIIIRPRDQASAAAGLTAGLDEVVAGLVVWWSECRQARGSDGVTGAVTGSDSRRMRCRGGNADIATQVSQSTAQSRCHVGVGQLDGAAGHLDRVTVDRRAEVLLCVAVDRLMQRW